MGQPSLSASSIGFQEIQVWVQVIKIRVHVLASAYSLTHLDKLLNLPKFVFQFPLRVSWEVNEPFCTGMGM